MLKRTKYDFIICGAGCAGLSLLTRMLKHPEFSDKHFLLLEKEQKIKNDRTWCFWEQEPGFFEHLVFKQWDALDFFSDDQILPLAITPYKYKMIRGLDFYKYCFDTIQQHPNVEIVYGDLRSLNVTQKGIHLNLDGKVYDLDEGIVFNSLYSFTEKKNSMRLLQHFRGWVIETTDFVFNPAGATFMDFRVHQDYGTAFVYVLPFSETKALVEYTLFTKTILEVGQYEKELRDYIQHFIGIKQYRVTEEESGVIPMTNQRFPFRQNGVFNIGAAGGQTKASTGYTFRFIQQQSARIVDALLKSKPLESIPGTPARFRFYDNTLLRILYHEQYPGKKIFTTLFKKNNAAQVLAFLDNDSSVFEEMKILATLPPLPFLKAAAAGLIQRP